MYSRKTGLILGFHGCDKKVVEDVVSGKKKLKHSTNDYDWLGHGIYFWDYNPSRAMAFAKQLANSPKFKHKVKEPSVLGAVIDLGFCLDLLDNSNLELIKLGYEILKNIKPNNMPVNKSIGDSGDLLLRNLDCAVIETLHTVWEENNRKPYDSVRGVFSEGKELYKGAGFKEKDHIQICIRNPNCIKGYFAPLKLNITYERV
jgi:hypothetical protein